MPMNLIWENDDHTLVRLEFEGAYSYEKYFAAIHTIAQEAKRDQHYIDTLNVASSGSFVPKGNPMKASVGAFRPLIDTHSLSIFVRPPRMVRVFSTLFEQMNPDATGLILYASSLEQAREMIWAHRQTDAAPKLSN